MDLCDPVRFKQITEAYEVLSDGERRALYERALAGKEEAYGAAAETTLATVGSLANLLMGHTKDACCHMIHANYLLKRTFRLSLKELGICRCLPRTSTYIQNITSFRHRCSRSLLKPYHLPPRVPSYPRGKRATRTRARPMHSPKWRL